jgi:LacI family transcriptional regulator
VPSHPFRIREIAVQAGLSEATVDRVLNGRSGVRDSTAREVRAAIADLERQRDQVRLAGRTFLIDVVMQVPARFSSAVRAALEAELPLLRPAVIRARFHFRETGPVGPLLETLDGIGRRGTQGIILKAPDTGEVNESVARLAARRIPVVTLVTDLPGSPRSAYIGIDNRAAGATAAYLITQWLGRRPGAVLVTLSRSFFHGEEEREWGSGRHCDPCGRTGGSSTSPRPTASTPRSVASSSRRSRPKPPFPPSTQSAAEYRDPRRIRRKRPPGTAVHRARS